MAVSALKHGAHNELAKSASRNGTMVRGFGKEVFMSPYTLSTEEESPARGSGFGPEVFRSPFTMATENDLPEHEMRSAEDSAPAVQVFEDQIDIVFVATLPGSRESGHRCEDHR